MDIVAVLHTAKATVPMLSEMIGTRYPAVRIYNWLDDSILPMLMEDRNNLNFVFEKMLCYGKMAENQGAKVILNACSSVGEFKDYALGKLKIPVVRIDEAVADIMVLRYSSIGVLATLETTLKPSADLIKRKTPNVSLSVNVVEGAWDAGLAGDKQRQNQLVANAVSKLLSEKQAVFLAQASMADALSMLPVESHSRVYTSPVYGVESLKQYL